jgi:putative ABC transport system permease protein
LIRSFYATQTLEFGFNPGHLLTAGINLTSVKYESDDVKTRAFWDELMQKIGRIPGVTDAALNNDPPLKRDRGAIAPFTVDGQPRPEPDHEPVLDPQIVSSSYFRTMQIPVLQGRDFDSEDTADKPNVIVVDTGLAKQFFPNQNPIGKSISIGRSGDSPHFTIVGVVPHVCHDTPGQGEILVNPVWWSTPPFQVYLPYTQSAKDGEYLIIRSNLNSASLVAAVRQAVASIDPSVPIFDAHPYDQVIAQRFVTRRLSTLLVALFSGAALFLSAVGLYGTVSYFVGQKSREIGIRMALGAEAGNILRLVAEQGLWPVGVGLTIGILTGLLLARFIDAFLYGVSAYDPITLALTVLVLGFATLIACLLPAARAVQINPTSVLNE